MRMKQRNLLLGTLLFACLAFVYAFHLVPQDKRLFPQVLSIVERGKLSIDDYAGTYGIHYDASRVNGKIYPGQAPGLVFLAVPPYALFRSLLRAAGPAFPGYPQGQAALALLPVIFLLVALPTLLTARLLQTYALDKGLDEKSAAAVALFYAVGSPAFSYGLYFSLGYHALSNLLALYAFVEATRARPPDSPARLALVGFSLGMLPLLFYPGGLVSLILGLCLLFRNRRDAIRYALPAFLVPVAVLLAYQAAVFGSPFSLPYHHRIHPGSVSLGGHFFGSTFPSLKVAAKLLVGHRRGLLLSTPLLAIAFFSATRLRSKNGRKPPLDLTLAWMLFLLFFVWNASRPLYWDGGTTGIFGPRYLIPALPFLFVMLIHALPKVPPAPVAVLGALSILANVAGGHYRQESDLDAIALFLTRGPHFPILQFLDSIPESARARFPDLFPPSQLGFSLSLFILLAACLGVGLLLRKRGPGPGAATPVGPGG